MTHTVCLTGINTVKKTGFMVKIGFNGFAFRYFSIPSIKECSYDPDAQIDEANLPTSLRIVVVGEEPIKPFTTFVIHVF